MTFAILLLQQPAPAKQSPYSLLVFLGLIFVIFWFLLIRPQRKRDRQRQDMLGRVKKNDKVLTVGGIYGTVRWVKGDELMVLVDESANTKLRMSLSSVARILSEEQEEGELSDRS